MSGHPAVSLPCTMSCQDVAASCSAQPGTPCRMPPWQIVERASELTCCLHLQVPFPPAGPGGRRFTLAEGSFSLATGLWPAWGGACGRNQDVLVSCWPQQGWLDWARARQGQGGPWRGQRWRLACATGGSCRLASRQPSPLFLKLSMTYHMEVPWASCAVRCLGCCSSAAFI